MKHILSVMLIFTLVSVNFAYWVNQEPEIYQDDAVDDTALDTFQAAKRRHSRHLPFNLKCVPYSMPCLPGSEYRFATCCGGLICMCNIWQTSCKCRSKLG